MIKIENVNTFGWETAIRGMRNPLNSWHKSDSAICHNIDGFEDCHVVPDTQCHRKNDDFSNDVFCIGKADMELMKRLVKAGVEHRTWARMVMVSMDVTAPLYWWKEMDRYRIGKEQISTSTMHKIHDKEFTLDDFSHEHLLPGAKEVLKALIDGLNAYRKMFLESKDKKYWWQMIQLLPSSYNQKRTIMFSYETAFKIIRERTGHKLDEWNTMVDELKKLPYMKELLDESTD